MTHTIDLMPAACRSRIRTANSRKRTFWLFVGTGSLLLAWSLLLHGTNVAKRAELSSLRNKEQHDQALAKELAQVNEEIAALSQEIARYATLSLPVQFSDVISALGEVAPESSSLTSLTISPRLERGAKGATRVPGTLVVEFSGLAPTDLEVATLVAGLESRPLFDRVTIDRSRPTDAGGAEAREFGVSCEIDLIRRRMLTAAPTEDKP